MSIDDLKGYLIKIQFNFDTKRFELFAGFPIDWTIDFGIKEINVEVERQVDNAILYNITSSHDVVDTDVLLRYLKNVIKHNEKISKAKEKLEEQKRKTVSKIFEEGKNLLIKDIVEKYKELEIGKELEETIDQDISSDTYSIKDVRISSNEVHTKIPQAEIKHSLGPLSIIEDNERDEE